MTVAYLDQDFTRDPKLLEMALDKTETRGGTAMRDAIQLALDHMKKDAKRDKKLLLVITDGNDNNSDESLAQTPTQRLPDRPVTRLPNWRSPQFCCSRGRRGRVPACIE